MATVREFPEQPETGRDDDADAVQERLHRVAPYMTREQRRKPRYGQPFFPVVPFGTSMYVLATVIALLVLSLIHPADLQNPADSLNHPDPKTHQPYNPRPEWYFLFLFQLLKYFQGPWEIVGTMVIPGIASVVLILLPFYDRNWSRRAIRRPIAIACAALALIGLGYLTYSPIQQTAALQAAGAKYSSTVLQHPTFANVQAIFAQNCQACHIAQQLGGLNLGSYQGVMAGGQGGGPVKGAVIKPGNPNDSYLYQAIEWKQKVGATMPLGARQKIPQVDRQNIYNWIKDGAKNTQ